MENFKYVLYLFSCASKGEKVEIIRDIDIKEIYNISAKHGIWNIVFLVVKQLYEEDKSVFNLNEELFGKFDFMFMQSISKNVVKWNRLPEILNELSSVGIDACLLKGLTLGVLYTEPYSRSTTDIDLLVRCDEEEQACDILKSLGFDVRYKWEGSHHTKCTRSDVGLIEIHTQLYDKKVQKLWFDMDETQQYSYEDFNFDRITCKQLNATDGLVFNFLHFVKHYIAGLVTVKQLMDVMLYIKKYKSKIDFDRFKNAISPLNYFKLYEAMKCLAIKYLGFTNEELAEDSYLQEYSDTVESILEDMNKYAASSNGSVYHIYTERIERERNQGKDIKTRKKGRWRCIYRLLWSEEKRMVELYGPAYRKTYLKLILQIHRILSRVINIRKYINKKNSIKTTENIDAMDRIILFEKLDVM